MAIVRRVEEGKGKEKEREEEERDEGRRVGGGSGRPRHTRKALRCHFRGLDVLIFYSVHFPGGPGTVLFSAPTPVFFALVGFISLSFVLSVTEACVVLFSVTGTSMLP